MFLSVMRANRATWAANGSFLTTRVPGVRRTSGTRVVKNDPFAAHIALLSRITDKNIHDVVAYLETLK